MGTFLVKIIVELWPHVFNRLFINHLKNHCSYNSTTFRLSSPCVGGPADVFLSTTDCMINHI